MALKKTKSRDFATRIKLGKIASITPISRIFKHLPALEPRP